MPIREEAFGRVAAKVESLERDVSRMREDVIAQRVDIADIKQILAQTKGGWKMLVALHGASASIGAAVGGVVAWLKHP